MGKCLILNSRQSKRPCCHDPWVHSTQNAVKALISEEHTFVTSVGLNTWELTLHLVNKLGGIQEIIFPHQTEEELTVGKAQLISSFRLDSTRCTIKLIDEHLQGESGKKARWHQRDEYAVASADIISPVSVRSNGNLAKLISSAAQSGKCNDNRFVTEYLPPSDRPMYDLASSNLNPALNSSNWDYLVHWTRSSHALYPGQTHYEYYDSILAADHYPNSAFDTLVRISTTKRLLASSRFIRGEHKVISFSAHNPVDAIKLMRWRKRYIYYSFEPHGIAIERKYAESIGFRPVIYGSPEFYNSLPPTDQPFYQSSGSEVSDWTPECEWRHLGDLDLAAVPLDKLLLIAFRPAEVAQLQKFTDIRVVQLTL